MNGKRVGYVEVKLIYSLSRQANPERFIVCFRVWMPFAFLPLVGFYELLYELL
jgi:hypothetical protein